MFKLYRRESWNGQDIGEKPEPLTSPPTFEALHSEFGSLIHAWIRRQVNRPEQVDEIAQEVFLKLFRSLSLYDPARPIRAWLKTLTKNTVIDWHRQQESGMQAAEIDLETVPSREPSPYSNLLKKTERRALAQLLRKMSVLQRRVMRLRLDLSLSYDEISKQLGISLDSTKCAMYRAKQILLDASLQPELFAYAT